MKPLALIISVVLSAFPPANFDATALPPQRDCQFSDDCCKTLVPDQDDVVSCFADTGYTGLKEAEFYCCRSLTPDTFTMAATSENSIGPFTLLCPDGFWAVLEEHGVSVMYGSHFSTKAYCCAAPYQNLTHKIKMWISRQIYGEAKATPLLDGYEERAMNIGEFVEVGHVSSSSMTCTDSAHEVDIDMFARDLSQCSYSVLPDKP